MYISIRLFLSFIKINFEIMSTFLVEHPKILLKPPVDKSQFIHRLEKVANHVSVALALDHNIFYNKIWRYIHSTKHTFCVDVCVVSTSILNLQYLKNRCFACSHSLCSYDLFLAVQSCPYDCRTRLFIWPDHHSSDLLLNLVFSTSLWKMIISKLVPSLLELSLNCCKILVYILLDIRISVFISFKTWHLLLL